MKRILHKTRLIEGSKIYFWFIFCIRLLRGVARRIHPKFKRVFDIIIYYLPHKEFIIKNELAKFVINSYDDTASKSNPSFEEELQQWVKLEDNKAMLDIGANIGFYSILAAKNTILSKIYAFEPNPETYKTLRKNIKINKLGISIQAFEIGLGNEEEPAIFVKNLSHTGGSHFVEEERQIKTKIRNFSDPISIAVRNYDNFAEEHNILVKDINFIKIDVEGFELKTLQGMKGLLENCLPGTKIFIEVWKFNEKKLETIDYLKNKDFKLLEYIGDNYLFEKK